MTESDLYENIGNTIIGYRSDGHRAAYYLRSETETVAHLRFGYDRAREVMVPSRIDGDQLCLPECYRIYQWGRDYVRAVDENGNTAFEGTVVQGNPRGIGQNAPAT